MDHASWLGGGGGRSVYLCTLHTEQSPSAQTRDRRTLLHLKGNHRNRNKRHERADSTVRGSCTGCRAIQYGAWWALGRAVAL